MLGFRSEALAWVWSGGDAEGNDNNDIMVATMEG